VTNLLEKMISYADSMSGKCLSYEVLDYGSRVEMSCSMGHSWFAAFRNLWYQKTWCPTCKGRHKRSLEEAQKLATSRGGQCLSTKYTNNYTSLTWLCAAGHTWKASLVSVSNQNTWCKTCRYESAKGSSFSIDDASKLAKNNNGECLSTSYVDIHSYLEWRCEKGHEWKASLNAIKNNKYWCKKCDRTKFRNTCLERYGVENPNQNKDIALKGARKINKPSIKTHWKTNEELVCQGSYEANVVDYLNFNEIDYKWQPESFKLSNKKTYRPDLYLVDSSTYIEIKGWWRDDAREKFDIFCTEYPHLIVEVWDRKELLNRKILTANKNTVKIVK